MVEIEADVPKRFACKGIKLRATCAFRKNSLIDRDMTFEHTGEAIFHLGCCGTHRDCACDVGGAVFILRTGINQKNAWFNFPV